MSARRRRAGPLARLSARPDPLTSVVLVIPVYLVYHLGILLIDVRNGVDLVSNLTFELLDQSVSAYVAATLLVAAGLAGAAYFSRRRGALDPSALVPVLSESILWALLMAVSVGWATQQMTAALSAASGLGVIDRFVLAAGAGLHEELVFRVLLVSGASRLLLRTTDLSAHAALAVAALASSLLFSAVHHLGPYGDALSLSVFLFRTLAGLYLSGVYLLRGFAVAVYTHTLYDVLVFFVFQ